MPDSPQVQFWKWVQANAPQFFHDVIDVTTRFVNENKPKPLPTGEGAGPPSFASDGTGRFDVTTTAITPEQIAVVRKNFADGIIDEEFCKFLSGLVTGLMMAGGGAA